VAILVAWSGNSNDIRGTKSSKTVSSFSFMAWVEVELTHRADDDSSGDKEQNGPQLVYQVTNAMPLRIDTGSVSSAPLLLSSLRLVPSRSNPESVAMLAISATTSQLLIVTNAHNPTGKAAGGRVLQIEALHPYWRFISLTGDKVILPSFRGGTSGGLVDCAHLVQCSTNAMKIIFTTKGGMTVAFHLGSSSDSNSILATKLWSSEEALSSISSAVFFMKPMPLINPMMGMLQ
jgi:hypothetical protein